MIEIQKMRQRLLDRLISGEIDQLSYDRMLLEIERYKEESARETPRSMSRKNCAGVSPMSLTTVNPHPPLSARACWLNRLPPAAKLQGYHHPATDARSAGWGGQRRR